VSLRITIGTMARNSAIIFPSSRNRARSAAVQSALSGHVRRRDYLRLLVPSTGRVGVGGRGGRLVALYDSRVCSQIVPYYTCEGIVGEVRITFPLDLVGRS